MKLSWTRLPRQKVIIFFVGFFFSCGVELFYTLAALKSTATSQATASLTEWLSLTKKNIEDNSFDGFQFPGPQNNIRLTLIAEDGEVLADNSEPLDALDNHKNRKEILAALNDDKKNSTILRKSDTTGIVTVYCATKIMIQGKVYVLRAAEAVNSTVYEEPRFRVRAVLFVFSIFSVITILVFLFLNNTQTALEKKARTLSERQKKAQSDFVSNVSHELKTPVASILGFSETLLESDLDTDEYNFAHIIYQQSKRLGAIIDDLLTLSRLETEGIPPTLKKLNLCDLVDSVLDEFSVRMVTFDMKVHKVYAQPNLLCPLNGALFTLAIRNIIDNAIKYCPPHSNLTITQKIIGSPPKKVILSIEDDGAGVPPGAEKRLFERFYRVDKGRSREKGGTGLGLAITYHIIKGHNGSITSGPRFDGGSGLRFSITLPLA